VPKLEQLRRVTLGSIVMVVVIGLVAWAVISAIADVGIDQSDPEFQAADLAWLVAAIVVVPLVGVPQAFGTIGSCIRPIRFRSVLALQWAIAFIALAVPSSAARIAWRSGSSAGSGCPRRAPSRWVRSTASRGSSWRSR
jgi:hypothetical protein